MANCNETDLRQTLRNNLGRIVDIFTDSGDVFTGVLSVVDTGTVKLICLNNHNYRDDTRAHRHCDDCENIRRILTIPIGKIDCLECSQY